MCQGLATTTSHLSPSLAAFQTTSSHPRAAIEIDFLAWFIHVHKYTADDYILIDLYIVASLVIVVVMVIIVIFPNNYSNF